MLHLIVTGHGHSLVSSLGVRTGHEMVFCFKGFTEFGRTGSCPEKKSPLHLEKFG